MAFTLDPALLKALAHPCLGALIGYLAGKIAIRMLFRPLRPWHIFGIRVPMTPGVIPARRRDLAANIGEVAGRHLLTDRDIGAAIADEAFQAHLVELADREIQKIFTRDLGPLPEIIPPRFRSYFQVGVKTLKYRIGEGINAYLAGKEFERLFAATVAARLDDLGGREIDALVDAAARRDMYLSVDTIIRMILEGDRAETWLAECLGEGVRQAAARGLTVGACVPDQLVDLAHAALREHAGPLLRYLVQAETRERHPGDLAATTKKPPAGSDDPEVGERMAAVLAETLDALLHRRLDALLAEMDEQRLDSLWRECAGRVAAAAQDEDSAIGLRALLHCGMERMVDGGRRTLADWSEQCVSAEGGRQVRETIVRAGLALLRSGAGERMGHAMAQAMIDALLARPVGRLYDVVPHGVRQGLVEYVVSSANRLLLQEVPGLAASLNLKGMVTAKVDGLSPRQLERLLLAVMEQRFIGIHLFGAALGFLLGLLNLALTKLG